MELLTVLLIISMLGGISAGVYQVVKGNLDLSGSRLKIEGIFQAAKNTAISSASPVRVIVDPVYRTVEASAFKTLGEWSFEENNDGSTLGAPMNYSNLNGASITKGHIGLGANISGGHIDCGNLASFDLRLGIQVQAWIRMEGKLTDPTESGTTVSSKSLRRSKPSTTKKKKSTSRRTGVKKRAEGVGIILQKGSAYYVGVTPDGRLEAGIGKHGGLDFYRVRTPPEAVRPGRWQRISMTFDGYSIVLAVDGIDRPLSIVGYEFSKPENLPSLPDQIQVNNSPVTIGSAKSSFRGKVDEVKLRGLVEPVSFVIPETQKILGWRKIVYFDKRGHLDPNYHDKPIRLVLIETIADDRRKSKTPSTKVVRDYSKTFQEWSHDNGMDLEGLTEKVEEAKIENQYLNRRKEVITIDRLGVFR